MFREYRRVKVLRVEGSNRSRRHRHVTVSPNKHHDVNDSGDVTKIELELEEAPYDAISVGSMPSGLDTTGEINSTYPDGIPGPGAVVVRAEEALIVILVLVLWVAAIALFFNRWGKIRMLEPYQPKFQQQHRQSYAVVEQNPVQNRSYSKFNVHCADHPSLHDSSYASGLGSRPRQNSVFVSPSISMLPSNHGTPRRSKSAFDLQSLVLAECQDDRDHDKLQRDQDILKSLRATNESTKFLHYDRRTSVCQSEKSDSNKPLLRERGTSICHFDRVDVSMNKPLQRDRGMSFCHFDRMDVLARPLQRDRGGSICHFDRTDVLARPLQRERGSGTSYFDRMDVLARPSPYLGRTGKERRVSVCNFVERDEENREARKDRRFSVSNFEKIEKDKVQEEEEEEEPEGQVIFTKCKPREKKSNVHQFDRPSCSKTPDVMLGYKATCV